MDLYITLNLWQLLVLILVLLLLGIVMGAKLRTWAENMASALALYGATPPRLRHWNPGPWKMRNFS